MTQEAFPHTLRAKLVADGAHYADIVLGAIRKAKVSVWIATANLKTTMIEAPIGTRARARGRYISLFETLSELAQSGLDICILHASPPSGPLRAEIARSGKASRVKLRQCPRVHLKMIAVDGRLLYLGSANLTGAGLGAKGEGRRNFEMGILTDSESMLDAAQARFDRIWRGAECKSCKLRRECPAPLDLVAAGGPKKTSLRLAKSPPAAPAATSRGKSRRTSRSPSSPR